MTHESEPNTVRLHRVLRAPAARVYKAFLDPDALTKWIPPHGFVGKIHESDFREGGGYRMSFKNLGTGSSHTFTVKFTKLVENQLIEHTDQFDDPNMPGIMRVTVELKEVLCGTELRIVQRDIPPQIPLEFCYLGWQESLNLLTLLTDPEIPDQPA